MFGDVSSCLCRAMETNWAQTSCHATCIGKSPGNILRGIVYFTTPCSSLGITHHKLSKHHLVFSMVSLVLSLVSSVILSQTPSASRLGILVAQMTLKLAFHVFVAAWLTAVRFVSFSCILENYDIAEPGVLRRSVVSSRAHPTAI
jgi:hypothetical protein